MTYSSKNNVAVNGCTDFFDVSVTSPTFRIVASLRQSLAVRQHCNPRHCDTHNTALFAGLVLQKEKKVMVWLWALHMKEIKRESILNKILFL